MDAATSPLGRQFVVLWAGQTLSAIGSTLSAIGVAVYVFVETGSAAWLGVLVAAAAIPYVVTGPFLPLVDRWPRRTMLVTADAIAAIGSIGALVVALIGDLRAWHLVVAGFVAGVGNAFQVPAFQAAVPGLVAADALDRANGLNQLGAAAGIIVGPALATPLVVRWGIEAVLLIDLATFGLAIAATTAVRFDDAVPRPHSAGPAVDDGTWRSTLTWLRGSGRPLITLLSAMAVVNFCLAGFNVAILSLATEVAGAARAGLVLAAGGVAMLAGTALVGRRGLPERRLRALSAALVTVGVGCGVAAARPVFGLVVAGVVVSLAIAPMVSASIATVFHEWVPASMQGRVFGLRGAIGRSLEPIGSVVVGLAIVHLASPALAGDGPVADSLGVLTGSGPERGPALALHVIGLALAALGIVLWRSQIASSLDEGTTPGRKAASDGGRTEEASSGESLVV